MAEYRIDELAHAAKTTARNVRVYRDRGLLPPPQKRGRVVIYDDSHLTRLRLIGVLLQRGFTTAHIADFIDGWESGKDLTDVLGLQRALTEPWSAPDDTVTISFTEAESTIGSSAQLQRLVEFGLARVEGDECTFTDPKLLRGFASLSEYGFDIAALLDIHEHVHSAVNTIAKTMIAAVKSHIVDRHGEGWIPQGQDVGKTIHMLEIMRALSVESVHATLERTLDANLREQLGEYLEAAIDKTPRSDRTSA
ncbi:MerR family transcriptional regulator [Rhodococcus sp. 14-2483-1-2]|uniref:MerR family transcriptional regulator n=1 Tax=Rhodococcus sp. 14-2483-1-2 TaxID=2023147 RepID=UPI000B9ACB1E|nr:MerR family transcriptional regulator [Rhodococcus sp. 14-2483-1-2]OZF26098.1 MerR family transcriptional regulator [Rhodococcus sp. 14-2483-1-2]